MIDWCSHVDANDYKFSQAYMEREREIQQVKSDYCRYSFFINSHLTFSLPGFTFCVYLIQSAFNFKICAQCNMYLSRGVVIVCCTTIHCVCVWVCSIGGM